MLLRCSRVAESISVVLRNTHVEPIQVTAERGGIHGNESAHPDRFYPKLKCFATFGSPPGGDFYALLLEEFHDHVVELGHEDIGELNDLGIGHTVEISRSRAGEYSVHAPPPNDASGSRVPPA